MFFAIRPIDTWHFGLQPNGNVNVTGLTFSGRPMRSASRTVSAQGVRQVEIEAPLGSISLTATSSPSVALHWTAATDTAKALSVTRTGDELMIRFTPPKTVSYGAGFSKLDVGLPQGLGVTANLDAGSMNVQGNFSRLSATLQAGALSVSQFHGTLSAHDNLGAINVQGATITGPLTLIADLGPVTFSGDPGLAATVRDQMGPVSLSVAPRGQLAVQGSVQMGPFSSGFPGIGLRGGGEFSGSIGHGQPGYLHVSDQLGPVTINQF